MNTTIRLKRAYDPADPADRWPEFRTRYMDQLRAMPEFAQLRKTTAAHPVVTLLYSSHDTARNNAVVVRDLLTESPT